MRCPFQDVHKAIMNFEKCCKKNLIQNDNADLERALILSYQENETMREILLARTPRQEK